MPPARSSASGAGRLDVLLAFPDGCFALRGKRLVYSCRNTKIKAPHPGKTPSREAAGVLWLCRSSMGEKIRQPRLSASQWSNVRSALSVMGADHVGEGESQRLLVRVQVPEELRSVRLDVRNARR